MLTLFLALAGGAAPVTPPPSLIESLAAPAAVQDEPAAEDEAPKWTGAVTVGAKYTTGNSDTRGANVSAEAELRRESDRFSAGFLWIYDENKNNPENEWTLTDRKTQGYGQYDYFFSKKTYGYGKAAAQGDYNADLALRQTYTLGLGHQFREDEAFKLGGELGVSYVDEAYRIASDEDRDYIAARVAYNFAWQISKVWFLGQSTEVFPSLEDSENIYSIVDTRLAATFGENFLAQLQWLWNWNNNPVTDPDTGEDRDKNDHQILLSIGWKL